MTEVDVITFGETMLLVDPAESGPLKYISEFSKSVGGAESNVAIGLAKLGHNVNWFSKLGADPHGEYIQSFVRGEGVDTSSILLDPDAPTGIMFKERRELGESSVYYYRHDSAASRMTPDDLPEAAIADATYLHLTGITPALSESCRETAISAVEIAHENDICVSFDPNIRYKLWNSDKEMRDVLLKLIGRADIVLPGVAEGEALFGTDNPEEIAIETLNRGAEIAVVKLGEEGALCADGNSKEYVPGYSVERVVDPIGAGDGFAAGFLSGQLRGDTLAESTQRANAVGAFATTVTGDVEGFPTDADLAAFTGEYDIIHR